jgi:Chaperone of endosialidase
MNPIIQDKTILLSLFIASVVGCIGLVPKTQAVIPAPDGGYPGFNTAEGEDALLSLTSGTYNTAVGFVALKSTTAGRFNTAVGAGALLTNTGNENTGIGAGALLSNTTGQRNTASGEGTLFFNTTGNFNTAIGAGALQSNTIGFLNTATGENALNSNTTGQANTATGEGALLSNTTGSSNTAIGDAALIRHISGDGNTAVGSEALFFNTNGVRNTAIGSKALFGVTGSFNTALGPSAGINLAAGSSNIVIGNPGFANESATIRIGADQTKTFIAGIRGVTTGIANAVPVLVDSAGQLGTASSSARFKKEIKPMNNSSEAVLALRPVTFHYKSDTTATPQFGLIAEDVAAVNPDLVVRDEKGEVYTVRYDAVNAMLLNEFLKEHRKVQELEANGALQQKQIEALTAGLQKVSAQLELSQPMPQKVVKNQ